MKKTLLALAAVLSCTAASAASYYAVVPHFVKGSGPTTPGNGSGPGGGGTTPTPQPPEIVATLGQATPPAATEGLPYSFSLAPYLSVTGDPEYNSALVTWSVTSGSLPAGITLDNAGQLRGTPTAAAPGAPFVVTANYKTKAGTQSYSITVNALQVQLAGATLANAVLDQAYSFDFKPLLSITGPTSYDPAEVTWAHLPGNGGNLPAGMAFSNGVLSGTPTGLDPAGQNLRITATYAGKTATGDFTLQPKDPHFANVHTLLRFDGSVTNLGNAGAYTGGGMVYSSAARKFGSSALFSLANNQYVTGPTVSATGSYTIEGWFQLQSTSAGTLVNLGGASSVGWQPLQIAVGWPVAGQINLLGSSNNSSADLMTNGTCNGCTTQQTFGAISPGTWYHFAVVRDASTNQYRMYLNGRLNNTFVTTKVPYVSGRPTTIGSYPSTVNNFSTTYSFPGYIDEVRITTGVARYSGNFVPQTFAHPGR